MPLNTEDVRTALKDCYDPEIPIDIVDLGLIYRVELFEDPTMPGRVPMQRAEVDMTLTTPARPAHAFMLEQVRNRLAAMPGLSGAQVNLVWEPTWGPARISEEGRRKLGIEGSMKMAR
ncbi:MAG: metal-sulfur cluster assembly factor [Acidobacteriaceae bacterium]